MAVPRLALPRPEIGVDAGAAVLAASRAFGALCFDQSSRLVAAEACLWGDPRRKVRRIEVAEGRGKPRGRLPAKKP